MPVAPYDIDKYRAWNRERMRSYRARIIIHGAGGGLSYACIERSRQDRRRREARIAEREIKLAGERRELGLLVSPRGRGRARWPNYPDDRLGHDVAVLVQINRLRRYVTPGLLGT